MIIQREVLAAVLPVTGTMDRGYALDNVQIEPDGRVVATNGNILLIAKGKHTFADADFPVVPSAPFQHSPDKAFQLPADLAQRLIKATAKKSNIPILATIQVSNGEGDIVTAVATDLAASLPVTLHTSDQPAYPKYDRVIPAKDRPVVVLVLSIEVLEDLLKAARIVHAGRRGRRDNPGTIKFSIPTTSPEVVDPIGVEIDSHDVHVTGCAMPCRM